MLAQISARDRRPKDHRGAEDSTSRTTRRGPAGPLAIGLSILAADQVTKAAAVDRACGPVICPLRNRALFLGFDAGGVVAAVMIGIAGLAVFAGWSLILWRRTPGTRSWLAVGAAGVAGNLVDRLTVGGVLDFLAVPGGVVLNIADIAIVVGLTGATWTSLRAHRRSDAPPPHSTIVAKGGEP